MQSEILKIIKQIKSRLIVAQEKGRGRGVREVSKKLCEQTYSDIQIIAHAKTTLMFLISTCIMKYKTYFPQMVHC